MSTAQHITAVALVCVATALFGAYGLRPGRATSDFYVASRAVSPLRNASAIGGEYLSAASFLGIAGLVLAFGADMLWYGVGYTAGYLVLLALVAAPLRRSGAYTVPDFAEARLESVRVRRLAALLVVLIGWLYLLPQLQGAGLTLRAVTGAPLWVGPVVVTAVVMITVASGGMRSVTLVQAFQYWLKLTALAIPVIFLLLAWRADGAPWPGDDAPPRFREPTTVTMHQDIRVRVDEPVRVTVDGRLDGRRLALARSARLRHGAPGRPAQLRHRPRALHRFRVRHGRRAPRDAALRRHRPARVLRERRAVPEAVCLRGRESGMGNREWRQKKQQQNHWHLCCRQSSHHTRPARRASS